ncbi:MAG TPA: N-acetylmuramoyl-L-alanine amidase [Chthoniobacterales bacterium]
MAARQTRGNVVVQRVLAWGGFALMLLCVVWLQFLPRSEPRAAGPAQPSTPKTISRVVIDAGHGGKDSGAIRNGIAEKDLTLDVALRVQRLVAASGLETTLTRSGDQFISLAGRAAAANRERDCIFVSIHFDEGTRTAATGVQTFYAARQAQDSGLPSWVPFLRTVSGDSPNSSSQSLAGFVQDALVSKTQAFNRGIKAEQFYVVANVRHPAVLVEGGFLSNNDDIGKLTTEAYREQLARAIVDGILRYATVARETPTTVASAE